RTITGIFSQIDAVWVDIRRDHRTAQRRSLVDTVLVENAIVFLRSTFVIVEPRYDTERLLSLKMKGISESNSINLIGCRGPVGVHQHIWYCLLHLVDGIGLRRLIIIRAAGIKKIVQLSGS